MRRRPTRTYEPSLRKAILKDRASTAFQQWLAEAQSPEALGYYPGMRTKKRRRLTFHLSDMHECGHTLLMMKITRLIREGKAEPFDYMGVARRMRVYLEENPFPEGEYDPIADYIYAASGFF